MAENKGNKKLGIIITFVLALIIVAGGTYFFTLKNTNGRAKIHEKQLSFCDLGSILVNLNDEGTNKYMQAQVSLSYNENNDKLKEELKNDTPLLKDLAIYYFKGQKAVDFSATNQQKIKEGLLKEVNKQLKNGQVEDICFQQLTIQ